MKIKAKTMKKQLVKKLLRMKKLLRVKKLKKGPKKMRLNLKKKMIEMSLSINLRRYMALILMTLEIVEWALVREELAIHWNSVKICIHSFSYPWSNLSTKSSVKSTKSKTLVNV